MEKAAKKMMKSSPFLITIEEAKKEIKKKTKLPYEPIQGIAFFVGFCIIIKLVSNLEEFENENLVDYPFVGFYN